MPNRRSRHELESGNGNDDELGKTLDSCKLGTDCPFEDALRRLQDEQSARIQSEAALAVSLDTVADKAQKVFFELETMQRELDNFKHEFQRKLGDFTREFDRHIKQGRYVELAIISFGAALGGFIAKLIVQ
jgi:hypothetical protein